MYINQLLALGTGLLSASILVTAQQQSGDASGNGTTSGSNGPQVQLTSANDFCLFLPPQAGANVATTEDDGIPFCMNSATVQGSQPFPQGFVTTAHYQQTESYTQITGFFDRTKYNLSPEDGGGQYDSHANHKPTGASCQNFPFFVSIIEPTENRFCIRCCQNTDDCKTGISQNGCQRVVTPGNYEDNNAFDAVPPSAANDGSAGASGASGSSSASAPASSGSSSASASGSDGPAAAASGDGSDDSSAGTGGDDASTGAAPGVDGTTTGNEEDHPNTSYNSVLDELDTASSSQGNSGETDSSSNGSDVKTVDDEAQYIQSQLQKPQVDLDALKTQFSTFAANLSNQFPDAADKIKQLESITSTFKTADKWQHLATVLQQKAPGAAASGN
ncbi:unnamed protein product [Absidia cylindrospora]